MLARVLSRRLFLGSCAVAAAVPGGISMGLLSAAELDTPLDFNSLGKVGCLGLGTAAVTVMDETTSADEESGRLPGEPFWSLTRLTVVLLAVAVRERALVTGSSRFLRLAKAERNGDHDNRASGDHLL